MKSIYIPIISLITSILINSLEVGAFNIPDNPSRYSVYQWSTQNNNWEADRQHSIKYNAQNKEVSRVIKNLANQRILSKDSLIYDAQGREIDYINYSYNTATGFTLNEHRETVYFEGNEVKVSYSYFFENGAWTLKTGMRNDRIVNGTITTTTMSTYDLFFGNQWTYRLKTEIKRDLSGKIAEVVTSTFDNGQWVLDNKEVYTGWFSSHPDRFTGMSRYIYAGNQWQLETVHQQTTVSGGFFSETITGMTAPITVKRIIEKPDQSERSISKKIPNGWQLEYMKMTIADTIVKEQWNYYDETIQDQLEYAHENIVTTDRKGNMIAEDSKIWEPATGWKLDRYTRYQNTKNASGKLVEQVVSDKSDEAIGFINQYKIVVEEYPTTVTSPPTDTATVCSVTGRSFYHAHAFRPNGVLITKQKVLIADGSDARIRVFTMNGNNLNLVSSYGTYGNGAGQLNNPQMLAADPNGLIYASMAGNGRIAVMSLNGNNLVYVNNLNTNMQYPSGMVFKNGYLYVSETTGNTITIFTTNGISFQQVGQYNNQGSSFGQLNQPMGMCVKDSLLYVADKNNSRIQVFKVQGTTLTFFRSFGGNGMSNGQFQSPQDVKVRGNEVYVSDNGNNRIQVFYFDGGSYQWIETIGSFPSTVTGSFDAPTGLDIDSKWVIVAENGNYRAQVLQMAPHRTLTYGGRTTYNALETTAYFASVTGIAPMVQWYNSSNTLLTTTSALRILNLSTHNIGNYYGKVLAGCRTYSTPSFQIQVNRLPQTVVGFILPDTVFKSQQSILLPQLRILGHSVTMYASSDNSVANWSWAVNGQPDTVKLSSRGSVMLTVGNMGNIYYLPISVSKELLVMETQTITATAIPTVSLSGSALVKDINFQSTSLENVSVNGISAPSNIFLYDNGKLTITGVGTITLTGYQTGDEYLLPAKPYNLIINVVTVPSINKSTQTVLGYHLPIVTLTGNQIFNHAFNFTATSGLDVRYAYATNDYSVVTLSGNVLSVSGPCTVTISGYQPGNAEFASAVTFQTIVQIIRVKPDSVINKVNSFKPNSLMLYPNPSTGQQWITIYGIQETTTVQILNTNGELVPFERIENSFRLNAPQGMYWIKTTQPNSLLKWVIQ
ncbi:MAG: T9SS type A sorting domain-containing protein [Bacteroidota bacterium]|nr:T9SS type A sorting domain-containing protein [Bacteroidota bacterium]